MLGKIGIQVSKMGSVSYEAGNNTYPVMSKQQQAAFRSHLESNYSKSNIDEMEDLIIDWKDDSYCNRAKTLERIFKKALGIGRPERNGHLSCRSPNGDEEKIAKDLAITSARIVEEIATDNKVTAYRGVGHCLSELAVELLENPNRPVLSVKSNTLSNYTPDRAIADTFGRVVLARELDPDKVALAADMLYPYRGPNGNIEKCHCELRVNGDAVASIERTGIQARGTSRPLIDLFRRPGNNTLFHHEIAAGVLEEMEVDGKSVSNKTAKKLIDRWYMQFLKESPSDAIPFRPIVSAVK